MGKAKKTNSGKVNKNAAWAEERKKVERTNQLVSAEWDRFVLALPELLKTPLKGRWVVFLNGKVASAHRTEERAFAAAYKAYGPYGGMVIARVSKSELEPIWLAHFGMCADCPLAAHKS